MIALQSFVDNLVCSAVRFVPRDKAAPKQVPKEKLKMPTPWEAELQEFEENGYIFIPNFLNDGGDSIAVRGGEE